MSGRTKVGIVSFAHMHACEYAAALSELGDVVEFAGVADPDNARGREAARRFGVPFAGVEELLGAADAVLVCSETRRHAEDAILALESGVHVLCEKPISTTVEDARKMLRAAEEAGRQLRMAFPVRYMPAVRQTKEVIESGEIGRVLAVNSTNHGKVPDGWFLDPDAAGGGAVMDHTVHLADALR